MVFVEDTRANGVCGSCAPTGGERAGFSRSLEHVEQLSWGLEIWRLGFRLGWGLRFAFSFSTVLRFEI